MERRRVRHHTNDLGLDGISRDGAIKPSRGWGAVEQGVHVEVEPFATARPFRPGQSSPKADLGLADDGAYVEFDSPADLDLVPYSCGPRNSAIIATKEPLVLQGLHPAFVRLRRYWWEFWRTRPE